MSGVTETPVFAFSVSGVDVMPFFVLEGLSLVLGSNDSEFLLGRFCSLRLRLAHFKAVFVLPVVRVFLAGFLIILAFSQALAVFLSCSLFALNAAASAAACFEDDVTCKGP